MSSNDSNNEEQHRILALYQFVNPKLPSEDLPALKQFIEKHCLAHRVRGSLLLAPEGINGTVSYPFDGEEQDDDDEVLSFLQSNFPGIRTRLSTSHGHVFYRLKIKVKKDILTCRTDALVDNKDPTTTPCLDPTLQKGNYVKPGKDWDALLQDPECLVIDARNDYEVRIGSFENAQDPKTTTFSDLIPWMQQALETQQPKKVAMFCTGGIRCEKASAACLDLASHQIPVYHLEGGILAYLDDVPEEESLWKGACYVFDQRVAVTHGLQAAPDFTMCHACRAPLQKEEQEGHADFIHGLQCKYCKDSLTEKSLERAEARQKQIELAQEKGLLHIHDPKEKVLRVLAGKKNESLPQLQQPPPGEQDISSVVKKDESLQQSYSKVDQENPETEA